MKTQIPKQLQKEDFRFILVKSKSKAPFEKNWTRETNYKFNDKRLIEFLDKGYNYGVLCGIGNIACLDIDDLDIIKDLEKKLPKTFTIKTGSGKRHYYFLTDIPMPKVVLDKNKKHYGELQGAGSQVIGPNSIHPNGKKYEIINNKNITQIESSKLLEIINNYTETFDKVEEAVKSELKSYGDSDINSISITSILNFTGFRKGSNNELFGPNPWHGSTTGTNTWINPTKNVGYCFRHNVGLSVVKIIALENGIISSCEDKVDGKDFIKVLKIAQEKYGLKIKENKIKTEFKLDKKHSIVLTKDYKKYFITILDDDKELFNIEYRSNPLQIQKTREEISKLLFESEIVTDKKEAKKIVTKAFSELKQSIDPLLKKEAEKLKQKKDSQQESEFHYNFGNVKETTFEEAMKIVERNFPELTTTLEVGLSVVETLRLKDLSNPIGVNFEGPPSSEKTTAISIIDGIPSITFMSDNFTPHSFVSHSANASEEDLEKIDLLPKIKNKVFLVPELAPLFGKRKEDLLENLSVLTRVFDGEGLETDSGSKGHRGYKGEYLFSWIGATTPLPRHVWDVMGKLGQRFFFLKIPPKNKTDEVLLSVIKDKDYRKKIRECKEAVHNLLKYHFGNDNKPLSVEWDKNKDDTEVYKLIVDLAKFVAKLRAPIEIYSERSDDKEEFQYHMAIKEEPERAINLLYAFARGHALLHNRNYLTSDDAWITILLALSSCPYERYRLLDLFEDGTYKFDAETAAKVIDCSPRHARRIMTIMKVLQLGEIEKTDNYGLERNTFILLEEYQKLMDKVEEIFKNKGLTWGGLHRQNDVQRIGIQDTFGRNYDSEDKQTPENIIESGHKNDTENSTTPDNNSLVSEEKKNEN